MKVMHYLVALENDRAINDTSFSIGMILDCLFFF